MMTPVFEVARPLRLISSRILAGSPVIVVFTLTLGCLLVISLLCLRLFVIVCCFVWIFGQVFYTLPHRMKKRHETRFV